MSNVMFIMLVGLPGSGKSYYAESIKKKYDNGYVFSSDKIRFELTGSEDSQDKNEEVFVTLHKRIKDCIKTHISFPTRTVVIYDACNISYKRRMAFLREIENYDCAKWCILVYRPYEECLELNRKRAENGGRLVPEHVIRRMYKNIYIPHRFEGWDNVFIQDESEESGSKSLYDLFYGENGLCGISHDNPHHQLSIGNHCIATMMKLIVASNGLIDGSLILAGLLHDIGKRFTKEFVNSKGEQTEFAHYYQHHHVGAYDSISYIPKTRDLKRIEVANLIQYHMFPFFWEQEDNNNKVNDKYRKMWGDIFYSRILLLHAADILAH